MGFEFPCTEPKITKEFLLSKNSEETYMSTYLGVPVKKGLLISPLRNDHRPTASFYRSKKNGDLIFHDFGTGFHGNFIGVVMEINKCTYWKALQIIAEDFHYIDKVSERQPIKIRTTDIKIDEKTDTLIQIEDRPFTEKELKWWKDFGISEETLRKYKVHACESVFLNGNYFCSSSPKSMAFGYYGGMRNGIQLWRIYFPQKRTFRFLSNWDKNIIQGAKQLPDTGDLLIITKSLKDVCLMYELGIPAIAPCSELLFLTNAQLNRVKSRFKKIICFYDNDLPGMTNLSKIRRAHPELDYFIIPKQYNAKDASDFCKMYGFDKTKECAEQVKNYFLNAKR